MFGPARYLADFARLASMRRSQAAPGGPAVNRLPAVATLAAALCCAGPAGGALAATATQTLAELNAQRAANGLPAGITEDRTLSSDCAAHDRYMALNHTLTHDEQPGYPGYSPGGAYAGRNAVLIEGGNWDHGNPYANAPLHLDQLLAPRLIVAGSADADGFSCTTTFPGWIRPEPATTTVYTYPGDGGTTSASELAGEAPWTPGDLVGIPQPTRTGPYLIVLADGPAGASASLSGATLTGPSGAVQVKTADGTTPVPGGPAATLGPYMSPGGFIIPVTPLRTGAAYHAHVVVGFGGVQTPHDWSFTVVGTDPESSLTAEGSVLRFSSSSPEPIRVSFTRPNGAQAPPLSIHPGHGRRADLNPGSWQACGRQAPDDTFAGYYHCVELIVTGRPALAFGRHHQTATSVRFSLRFSSVLRGRSATLTIVALSVQCAGLTCTTSAGHPVRHVVILVGSRLSLPLPAPGHGYRLTLDTRAFQLADAPWTAAHATTRYVRHAG